MKNNKGFLSFLLIWGGQLGSLLGSSLTSFALGVYVLQKSGSIANFSITLLCMTLPGLIAAPFVGILVDKWSRKGMMLLSDILAAAATLGIGAILIFSHLELWHIYISVSIASISGIIQFPAYQSIVSQIVEKEHLGRANGLIQVCESATMIVAPPLAGVLLPLIQLQGIIVIDFFSFFLAIFSLLFVKIPSHLVIPVRNKKQSVSHDLLEGINYLRHHRSLLWLLVYFAFTNFLLGFVNVLLQPLILSISNVQNLGIVLSCLGLAMAAGGLVMSLWGGPRKKAKAILYFGSISACASTFVGASTSIPIICIFLFVEFFFLPFGNSCSQVIWQTKVELKVQGRVFALRRMIAMSLMPIAYGLSGPLNQYILSPFMAANSVGTRLFGSWLGSGEQAGIRLFFIIIGLCWLLLSVTLSFKKEIKHLDEQTQKEQNQVLTV